MFWTFALRRDVILRSAKTALFVGFILIAINHGDSLLHGELETGQVAKMLLTFAVPYCVSTYASVGALRSARKDDTDNTTGA